MRSVQSKEPSAEGAEEGEGDVRSVSPYVGSSQGSEGIEPGVLGRTSETHGEGRKCSTTVLGVVGRFL